MIEDKFVLRKRSYQFSLDIVRFVRNMPNQRIYWTMSDQLLRAGTSIGANVIEAKASSTKKDFTNYYHIVLKSAHETEYWLLLIRDTNLIGNDNEELPKLLAEVNELCKMLSKSLTTLKYG